MKSLVNRRFAIAPVPTNVAIASATPVQSAGQAKLIQRFFALLMTSLSAMNV